jgi:hypothetical protein
MPRGNKPRVSPAIEAALQKKGNLSDLDLAKMCFCVRRSAARILFDMHRHELVHISGYTRVSANGQWRPLWSWGEGVDAIAPGPVPGIERIRKHREKMSADDKDFGLARRRQKRRVVKRDPLVAAFFGGKT